MDTSTDCQKVDMSFEPFAYCWIEKHKQNIQNEVIMIMVKR